MKKSKRFQKQYRGTECLNCGTPLEIIDQYCHQCGQLNTTKKLSFTDFFTEFFSSIFSYDSRLRHTIVALLFKPGKISKEYIQGKRAKYANPFRFYLSVSILFFIAQGLLIDFDTINYKTENGLNDAKKDLNDALQEDQNDLSDIIVISDGKNKITPLDSLLLTKGKVKDTISYTENQLDSMGFFKATEVRWDIYKTFHENTGITYAEKALDSLNHAKTRYNKFIYRRSIKTKTLSKNPATLIKFIFNKLPLIIFFFLPFFTLSIWLLYIRRSFTYMEHLVFIFHIQTMFFILLSISLIINQITGSEISSGGLVILVFLFYLYKAIRKFYDQSRFKSIVKFMLINILFFILACIGTVIAIGGSLFIY